MPVIHSYADGETNPDPIVLAAPNSQLEVSAGEATQAGAISDSGPSYGFEKIGAGTLTLTGDNTYTGPTLVSAGRLVLDSDVIDTTSAFTIASGATLAFGDTVALAFLGSIQGAGDVDLGAGVFLELDDISSDLTFSGSIFDDADGEGYFAICGCGGGSLTLTGDSDIGGFLEVGFDGELIIDGGSFTSGLVGALLDGTLRVVNGGTFNTTMIQSSATLEVDGSGSTATASELTDIARSLVVSGGGLLTSEADAILGSCGCEETPATADVIGTGSHWDITGTLSMDFEDLPGVLTVADGGKVSASVEILLAGDSAIRIGTGGNGGTIVTPSIVTESDILANFTDAVTLGAAISGAGGIDKDGAGVLTLTGISTYLGATTVAEGRLNVNGSITSATSVEAGGALGGRGTVAAVTIASGGTLTPGTSTGIITTGNLSLAAGAAFEAEIGGTTAGTGYDRAAVNGTVTLGGATLDLSFIGGFAPGFGSSYTIVLNDGTDAVSGQFAGLAEGATFLAAGRLMSITYQGGDGNDVVIRKTPPPTTITGTAGNDLIDATHTVAGQPLPTGQEDLIKGLGGNDTIDALGGADEVTGDGDKDTIAGGDGNDTVKGGNGADTLAGDAGNDVLVGAKASDLLKGSDGDDRLTGGKGKNKLFGGEGDDIFVFKQQSASDKVKDFADGDTVALSKSAFAGIGPKGVLKAKYFHVGDEALTKNQHVLYDEDSGWLLYAKHGSDTANPHAFARIGKHLDGFDHADILVI